MATTSASGIYLLHEREISQDLLTDLFPGEFGVAASENIGIYKHYDGSFSTLYMSMGSGFNLTNYLSSIGSNNRTLIVDSEILVSSDTTIPSNISIVVNQGGCFNIFNSRILTIEGSYQGFFGRNFKGFGTVIFSNFCKPVFKPEYWGAVGDAGTTNNTSAIAAMSTSLQGSGGGVVELNGGNYYTHTGSLSATLFELDSVPLEIKGNGSTITCNRSFSSGQTVTYFKFTNCKNVSIDGLKLVSQEDVNVDTTNRGVLFTQFNDACENISLTNIQQYGGKHLINTETTSRAIKAKNIQVRNCFTRSVGYPVNLKFSGDHADIEISCEKSYRSYFCYGVSNHRIVLADLNPYATSILAGYNSTQEFIDISYYNVGSSGLSIAAPSFQINAVWVAGGVDSGPSVFRNIKLNGTVNIQQTSFASKVFSMDKALDGGGADGTERGHKFENITFSGTFIGASNNFSPIGIAHLAGGLWGSGETLRSIKIENVFAENTSSSVFNFGSLKDIAVFNNVSHDNNLNVEGSTTGGKIVADGVKCRIFWSSNSDSSDATFSRCEFTNSGALTNEAKLNKAYIDCLFYTTHIPIQMVRASNTSVEFNLQNRTTSAGSNSRMQVTTENGGGDPTIHWEIYNTSGSATIQRASLGLDNTDLRLKGSGSADPGVAPWLDVDVDTKQTKLNGEVQVGENLKVTALGYGIQVKAGTNGRINLGVVLVGGTVTVANSSVTTNTIITCNRTVSGGTLGHLSVTKNAGVGYTINSTSGTETSTIDVLLTEAI